MKISICLLSLLLVTDVPSRAALYTYNSGTLNNVIPDYTSLGMTETAAPGDFMPILTTGGDNWSIIALTLKITLTGGDPNDLSGYLRLGNTETSPYFSFTSLGVGENTFNFGNSQFHDSFSGQNPNNSWTLFFADTVAGDTMTLNGWSLEIEAVPEPTTWAAILFGVGFVGTEIVRKLRSKNGRRSILG
jgi:hypothetical protein